MVLSELKCIDEGTLGDRQVQCLVLRVMLHLRTVASHDLLCRGNLIRWPVMCVIWFTLSFFSNF